MIKAVVVDMDGIFLTTKNDYDRERFKKSTKNYRIERFVL